MGKEVISVGDLMNMDTLRLPTNPGHEVNGLDFKLCTYFNSFTTPLKLVFKSVEHSAANHYLMYKVVYKCIDQRVCSAPLSEYNSQLFHVNFKNNVSE